MTERQNLFYVVVYSAVCGFVSWFICLWMMRRYASSTVGRWTVLNAVANWWMAFVIIWILPADVAFANVTDATTPQALFDVVYVAVFTAILFSSWVLTPLMVAHNLSGYFDWREKFLRGFQEMLLSNRLLVALWGIFVANLALVGAVNPVNMIYAAWAVAGVYGGFLFIVCLGYGLVEVPRRLWLETDADFQLNKKYVMLYESEEEMTDVMEQIFDCYRAVRAYEKRLAKENVDQFSKFWKGIASVREELPFEIFSYREQRKYEELRTVAKTLPIRLRDLIHIRARAQIAVAEYMRLYGRIDMLFNKIQSTLDAPEVDNFTPNLIMRLGCLFCFALSVIVFITELLLGLAAAQGSSLPAIMLNSASPSVVLRGVVTFVMLVYIAVCAFYALFHLNLGKTYRIHADGNSQWYTVLRNSEYVSRISFFIALNFTLLINDGNTVFHLRWNNIDSLQIPIFGTPYHRYIPLTLIFFAPAAALGVFVKVTYFDKLGFQRRDAHILTTEDVYEGKKTFSRELERRRQIVSGHDNMGRISEVSMLTASSASTLFTIPYEDPQQQKAPVKSMSERVLMRLVGSR
eukprot:TRINITY_DN28954_c0_g1_i1.p1 TRINITY_DN28954_c0_g1~~TRINITY_DN28954_c0_g1_i1.p1  ORF type:complete len:576 (-),score=120.68 TRINITY_DN28954_c0_g1_i1:387-2114(-)